MRGSIEIFHHGVDPVVQRRQQTAEEVGLLLLVDHGAVPPGQVDVVDLTAAGLAHTGGLRRLLHGVQIKQLLMLGGQVPLLDDF